MAELPILHSKRAAYDWVERLGTLREAYERTLEAEPERAARDARWLDVSLVYHSLRLRGLDLLREEVEDGAAEARGALAAAARVREAAAAGATLTADLLVELNGLVDPERGGRLRNTQPVAAYRGHEAPGPEALAPLLENAADWFTAPSFTGDFHPVEQAALALVRICDLQPFPSNNELTARVAASVFTLRAGWPPIVVHHELEAEYRDAVLHAMHMDTQPIVELLAKCVELSYADLGIVVSGQ
jgi:Fic family protein